MDTANNQTVIVPQLGRTYRMKIALVFAVAWATPQMLPAQQAKASVSPQSPALGLTRMSAEPNSV